MGLAAHQEALGRDPLEVEPIRTKEEVGSRRTGPQMELVSTETGPPRYPARDYVPRTKSRVETMEEGRHTTIV